MKGKKTMTQREFLTKVMNGEMSEEIQQYAAMTIEKAEIAKAKKAEKAKNEPSAKAIENAPIKEKIMEYLKNTTAREDRVASVVASNCEISTQKASRLLLELFNDSKLTREPIKLPKKSVQFTYSIAE